MSVLPSDIAYYGSLLMPQYDGAATLNGAVSSTTATTLAINAPTSAFPSSGEFPIQVDSEVMWVTQGAPGNSAGTLTVIRGFNGSTAATHSNGASVTMPAGGSLDMTTKLNFSDITSGDTADWISTSSSDTLAIFTGTGRDTTGVFQTETKTLNGTTAVTGSQVWDRMEQARPSAGTTTTAQISSSGTTLAVTGHTNFPSSGNYQILMGKEYMTVTGGQGTNSWTVTRGVGGTTATVHQSGDNVYLCPIGDVAWFDHTKVITGHTAQTGSANSTGTTPALMKLQSGDGSSVSIGQIIYTTGGTGPNQMRTIIAITGYGTDVVAVSRNWGTVPDNTTTYNVYNGMQLDLSPNQVVQCNRFCYNAAAQSAGGSQVIFYQKLFAINNNTSTALTSATVEDASNTGSLPGSALLDLATATSANDTVSWVNRQTVPGSGYGSFVTQPATAAYGANSGVLANGAAPNTTNSQGIVMRLTLPAGTTSYKGYADLRTQGTTT